MALRLEIKSQYLYDTESQYLKYFQFILKHFNPFLLFPNNKKPLGEKPTNSPRGKKPYVFYSPMTTYSKYYLFILESVSGGKL
jgi:hypothetical protein